ncbi:MAG TPA: aminotransferase class I/II-fold pyridoxal phosphate-dependent enzyme [Anaerolineaceae bacterium]|mgnify:CR=1 FL=1|nr:aminotransferase class I/II-fold pyridoxal phosphate-dependent enzyme [Anaerolineaceae bacterium]HPN51698.1 aminotransferase class I/II-fold pyridoxal phosphate-dependent enzyme [Anaerolineaceae bacterium]
MPINPFVLERYFAQYEFKVKYLLSSSDCESLMMADLLTKASPELRHLWENLSLGYTESQGHPLLRQEISTLYHISPDQILVAAPEECIFIAMQTLLSTGDQIICISPAYQSLAEIARSIGCNVTPWNLSLQAGKWHLDINELEQSITDHMRALILNFPHNPTGFLPSLSDFNQIIDIARKSGAYIFMDEMYRGLEYQPTDQLPSICDVYEKGISLSGLSKTCSLPGLRTGWLATQDPDLPSQWIAYKDYTTICNSAPAEILALMALQSRTEIISRNLNIILSNLSIAEAFYDKFQSVFTWIPPLAGSIAFPKWTGAVSIDQFCLDLVEKEGIMLVPASKFKFPGQHFRLGLGRKNFPEALNQLEAFMVRNGYSG